jgi:hypothetical protein
MRLTFYLIINLHFIFVNLNLTIWKIDNYFKTISLKNIKMNQTLTKNQKEAEECWNMKTDHKVRYLDIYIIIIKK